MMPFFKKAFGLDVSDASVEALEIKEIFGQLKVSSYGRIKLVPGIVDNGNIIQKDKLAEAIRQVLLIAEPRPIKNKNVIVSIPEKKVYSHIFEMPAVISAKQMSESIQYEAEEIIPLFSDQTYHDFQIISRNEKWQEVYYFACAKEVVDGYEEVLKSAGLKPLVFDTESAALARALIKKDSLEGVVIVDIGARTTIINIFDNHGIRYSNNIFIGGNKFTDQITSSLKIDHDEAERVKRETGLVGKESKIKAALEPLIKEIIEAIQKAIQSYQKKTGFAINKVILAGGSSLMPGLREHLAYLLSIKVEAGDPLDGLQVDRDLFKTQPPILFSTVIGLARRGLGETVIKSGFKQRTEEKEQKEPRTPAKAKLSPKDLLKRVSKLKPSFANKRVVDSLVVFIVLILVFVGILLLSRGREESLIQFQSVDYPTGPVEYDSEAPTP